MVPSWPCTRAPKPIFPPDKGSSGRVSPLEGTVRAAAWREVNHRLSPQYQEHPLPALGPSLGEGLGAGIPGGLTSGLRTVSGESRSLGGNTVTHGWLSHPGKLQLPHDPGYFLPGLTRLPGWDGRHMMPLVRYWKPS